MLGVEKQVRHRKSQSCGGVPRTEKVETRDAKPLDLRAGVDDEKWRVPTLQLLWLILSADKVQQRARERATWGGARLSSRRGHAELGLCKMRPRPRPTGRSERSRLSAPQS